MLKNLVDKKKFNIFWKNKWNNIEKMLKIVFKYLAIKNKLRKKKFKAGLIKILLETRL